MSEALNAVIAEIYRDRAVTDADGTKYPLHSNVDPREGDFIYNIVASDPSIIKTMEVGCAYGLSALHIAKAMQDRPGAHHIMLDPFQYTDWKGIGMNNLKRAGVECCELLQEKSELAMPRMLSEAPESFDMIFIDGWHTFDHTLIDLYYANRLVKVGGYIVTDDCGWRSVAKAVDYFAKYPCFEKVGGSQSEGIRKVANTVASIISPSIAGALLPRYIYDHVYTRAMFPSMVALKKIAPDDRNFDWFESF